MKTISQIAKETGCTYDNIYQVIINNRFTPVNYEQGIRKYAKIQVDFIYKMLYFERKCNVITLESSMSKKETFEEHKKKRI